MHVTAQHARATVALFVGLLILAVAATLVTMSGLHTTPQAAAIHNGFGGAPYSSCPYASTGLVRSC